MQKDVKLESRPTSEQTKVKINYSGLLAESGAEEIYLHAGLGNQHNWQATTDIKMYPAPDKNTWTAELNLATAATINFCFKDSANNWDNKIGRAHV